MNPFFMVAMIGLSGTSVCCLAGTAHGRLKRSWIVPICMLAAMVLHTVPGVTPGELLIAAGLLLGALPLSVSRPAHQVSASAMQLHQALSAVFMAVVILVGLGESSARDVTVPASAVAEGSTMPGMAMGGSGIESGGLEAAIVILVLAYLLLSAWTARGALRRGTRAGLIAAAEVIMMAAAMLLMVFAP